MSIEEAIRWLEAREKRGDYHGETARLWVTGINRLTSVLDADEPKTVDYVLENLDALTERFARKNPEMSAGSANAYKSRTKNVITEYLRWSEAPEKFQPMPTGPGAKKEKPEAKSEKERVEKVKPTPAPTEAPPPSPRLQPKMRDLPLAGGRTFDFVLPADGLTRDDVVRIAAHLLTFAHDVTPQEAVNVAVNGIDALTKVK